MLEKTLTAIDTTLSSFLSSRSPIETLLLFAGAIHCVVDYFAIKYFREQIDLWKGVAQKEESKYDTLVQRQLRD